MVSRLPRMFGSALLLTGAFAVGGVIHGVAVEGTIRATSPAAVGGLLVGGLLLLAGRRLEREFDPSEYVPGGETEDESDGGDEELTPVPEGAMEGREADEEYEDR